MSLEDLAMLLEISPPSVRTYLERGEGIARGNGYRLIEYFFTFWAGGLGRAGVGQR